MNFKKKIYWAFSIIKSGFTLRDSFILTIYFLLWPLRRTVLKKMVLFGEVLVQNEGGVFFCGKKFSAVSCVNPLFEKNLQSVFKSIKKGNFIDIGSNVGKYTIMMGNRLKDSKIISIEPEINNFEFLKKSIYLNQLKNISLFNLACSSRKGERNFFIEKEGIGMHSFYQNKLKSNIFIKVKTEKLDNLIFKKLNKNEIKKISLIKIDVEGAEVEVLKGAKKILKLVSPKILVEVWEKKSLENVRKILFPLGFSERRMDKENYLYFKKKRLLKLN